MMKAITKLKATRKSLLKERGEIDTEVERIDVAIEKFEEGITALKSKDNGTHEVKSSRKKGATAEIEKILRESKEPTHISSIMNTLKARGFETAKSTVSAMLQVYAKKGKRFVRTAPATFTILESEPNVEIIGKL